MSVTELCNKFLRRTGNQLVSYPDRESLRHLQILESFKINKILDIGGNVGGYGHFLMSILGYKGKLISFEPVSAAFNELEARSKKHAQWSVVKSAIGNMDGEIEINIAANKGLSSSIADMLPTHIENAPEAQYVSKEKVPIRKLDSIFDQYVEPGDNVFLKIDTQGYEKNVLDGAEKSLPRIKGIQVEMSLVPLYSGEMLFPDMLSHLTSKGYMMFHMEPVFTSPTTGQLLQVDGMFFTK
ncbi:MAG TPA: FkbM family methyltransferase [Puia sp.]|jgi:FkbM family methyltransferase